MINQTYEVTLQNELEKARAREKKQLVVLVSFAVLTIVTVFLLLYVSLSQMQKSYDSKLAVFEESLQQLNKRAKDDVASINNSADMLEVRLNSLSDSAFLQIEEKIESLTVRQNELEQEIRELTAN